ncbi:similar to Saccharomyces cerevisiae YHR179W OYE2 Conserved NADPH oxidoreductase containing flavin mononucleotide (FMN) [Maudiozyma saulgeensis]|uniref:Similar to Saccharomyces cerevisiae YHR179W OYE2 Conserved NADPH oxidoreductase containing flavin mononucleotide (FMN) n=1 Tax=Maudiozyma saulgeensis TaxID=1789683 RepID=A0A1X7RA69_9SACH|nr:similar to Saccharomyces cerevisiae YHR179W OYE2 Conserved NADPH oxidoreductase containing flavin mononucleotide (FMN) [Kazachstania saulgeensis]
MPFSTIVKPTSFEGTNMFNPLKLGDTTVLHRAVLAPLTRMKASYPGNIPNTEWTPEYYSQRSQRPGTTVITESTYVSKQAGGFDHAPGIWSQEQIEAWRPTFKVIHDNGSFCWVQLWALGWEADIKNLTRDGLKYQGMTDGIYKDKETENLAIKLGNPIHGLSIKEIKQYIADHVHAAKNSLKAGADGIELHVANGYLLMQSLDPASNKRDDQYGGSIENRARFVLEIVDALIKEIGASKIGIRISPFYSTAGMSGGSYTGLVAQYAYLLGAIESRAKTGNRLAYVHIIDPIPRWAPGNSEGHQLESNDFVYSIWKGPIIRAGGLGRFPQTAKTFLKDDRTLVAYGRYFISNPDLVDRLQNSLPLNEYDEDSYYTMSPNGYIDYPTYDEALKLSWKI